MISGGRAIAWIAAACLTVVGTGCVDSELGAGEYFICNPWYKRCPSGYVCHKGRCKLEERIPPDAGGDLDGHSPVPDLRPDRQEKDHRVRDQQLPDRAVADRMLPDRPAPDQRTGHDLAPTPDLARDLAARPDQARPPQDLAVDHLVGDCGAPLGPCQEVYWSEDAGGCATRIKAGAPCEDGKDNTYKDYCDNAGVCRAGITYTCYTSACVTSSVPDGKGGCTKTLASPGTNCAAPCVSLGKCDAEGGCQESAGTTLWTEEPPPSPLNFQSVFGFSGSEVWAAGTKGTVIRYNGSTWNDISPPLQVAGNNTLTGIWGSSPTAMHVVGVGGTAARFSGAVGTGAWAKMDPGVTTNLNGVYGYMTTSVYAVGSKGEVLSNDGTSLAYGDLNFPISLVDLNAVFSYYYTYVVGTKGVFYYYSPSGSAWSPLSSGTLQNLLGVHGASTSSVFAVGTAGTLLFLGYTSYGVHTLALPASVGTPNLKGVWSLGATDAWIVGQNGALLHFDGAGFTQHKPGALKTALNGVWARKGSGGGALDVVAVGDSGKLLHCSTP